MIEKLMGHLPPKTASYIEKPENRRYYTGFTSSNGFLFVTSEKAIFYTDFRYITAAEKFVDKRIEVRLLDRNRFEIIKELVTYFEMETLLIEENYISYASAIRLEKAISPCRIQ